ncbi:substrate-binding domain-containing protein [Qipengyuania aurantiaca]|uniref:Substrate-binding domain-containing protein n=1 Tax=Qipengyuania aurantiaca TaxID=2867233 RepID=A0ABX8ZNE4_9SPHN|nr:substrate-binding domain-containing protein [Qipengyuania aurantiaca]QZD89188.1 substrate-binding domain-containing protein [Qipengyuania aurantiaca]
MTRPSGRILMLFDNMNRDYVSRLHSGASREADAVGLQLQIENIHATDSKAESFVDDPVIAGVILTAPLCDDRHVMLQIEKRDLPFARIASMLDPGRGITVAMDEYDAARSVTALLLEAGHRRVGIIRGPRSHLSSMRRYNGFTAALGSKGVKLVPSLVAEGDYTRKGGEEAGARLLAAKPTAIFASNDAMAAGLADAARKASLSVPRDVSIVGFDDDPIAKSMHPPLTSVRQPLEDMGAAACKLLAGRMVGRGSGKAHTDVPFELVERASIAPPGAAG